jgi:formate dehydrogenase assembly factor FdhD
VPYLNAAMRLSEEERMAVLAGRRPLIAPKQPKPAQQAAEARAQVDAAMARLNEALQLIADVGADHAAALAAEEQKADA